MLANRKKASRPGAALLESAIVFPLVFFVLIALVVGSMGILRYQEVAKLSQEGARYASVHGSEYRKEVSGAANSATPKDIFDKGIRPRILSLNPADVTYQVSWADSDQPFSVSGTSGAVDDYEKAKVNTVTVTVTYRWFPEAYLVGPINLTCTTTLPMAY